MARMASRPEQPSELHVKIPDDLRKQLFRYLATMRKKEPMATLSDAVRELLEEGLKAQ